MAALRILFIPILAWTSALLACGGGRGEQWESECHDLRRRSVEMEQRHSRLQAQLDSLWDVTATRLDQTLPADFPAIDRRIFLQARNADHIRMFMSYKQLDARTKALVEEAGKQDAVLAAALRTLLTEQQAFEQEKIQFLRKVERQDQAASRRYAGQLRAAAGETSH